MRVFYHDIDAIVKIKKTNTLIELMEEARYELKVKEPIELTRLRFYNY